MNDLKHDDDEVLDSEDEMTDNEETDDELKNEKKNMRFEPVNAIISERGDIYYMTNYDG